MQWDVTSNMIMIDVANFTSLVYQSTAYFAAASCWIVRWQK